MLRIAGFEEGLEISENRAAVLEVEDEVLFGRICASLHSEEGSSAVEPYALWDGESPVSAKGAFLLVYNPFDLPWNDRALQALLLAKVESLVMEDDSVRMEIEGQASALSSALAAVGLQMLSDYVFSLEWDVKKYLKSFGFGVDAQASQGFFDNLMLFLKFVSDAGVGKPIAFLNLKKFLSENEIETLYEQAFLAGVSLLLLEGTRDARVFERELKMRIDRDFLQH